jgi:multiple sugar transport system permease protein
MSSASSVEQLGRGVPIDELEGPTQPGRAPRVLRKILAYFGLAAVALISILPFYWMVNSSLKSLEDLVRYPPSLFPESPQWQNYTSLWKDFPMNSWIWNSFKVSSAVTLGTVATSAMAAYAFARLEFPGRNILFLAFLATMMVPVMVFQVPKFALIQKLGWQNTHTALIVPALAGAFGVFLLRQFFLTLPKELEEAARIDGAGHWTIFWRFRRWPPSPCSPSWRRGTTS